MCRFLMVLCACAAGVSAAAPARTAHADGHSSPACTGAALHGALAAGGTVTFDCGSGPVTITVADPAQAAASVVTSCLAADLVSALAAANGRSEPSRIDLAAGCTYEVRSSNNSDPATGANGLPVIVSDVTINGHGASIKGNWYDHPFRLFRLAPTGTLRLNDVTLSGGATARSDSYDRSNRGGCIYNGGGSLILDNTIMTENAAGDGYYSYAGGDGGAIFNDRGTVIITRSALRKNGAGGNRFGLEYCSECGGAGGSGGGVFNDRGTVIVVDSTIADNFAGGGHRGAPEGHRGGDGGGIVNAGGTLALVNSTVSGNAAGDAGQGGLGSPGGQGGYGGGIVNTGALSVTNSTISDNRAGGGGYGHPGGDYGYSPTSGGPGGTGGGISNSGTAQLLNCTVMTNAAGLGGPGFDGDGRDGTGGGLYSPGAISMTNTIIAGSSRGRNCVGPIVDGSHNLQWPGADCGASVTSADPRLDPAGLQDHGGATRTIAVLPESPAINAGDPQACADAPVNGIDQRGYVRPGTGSVACSIGAYEYNASPPPTDCTGDCDGDRQVAISELIRLVNIALGAADGSTCPAGDRDADGAITIPEIIGAVHNSLHGCGPAPVPSPTATPTSTPTSTTTPTPTSNRPRPFGRAVAEPNPAQSGERVRLFAVDIGGAIRSYEWRQVAGDVAVELAIVGSDVFFTAPAVETPTLLHFGLTLTSYGGTVRAGSSVAVMILPRGTPSPPSPTPTPTPTPTNTPTATPTSCVSSPPLVRGDVSPTNQLVAVLQGYSPGLFCFRGGYIEIRGAEVLALSESCNGGFLAIVRLRPNQTNRFDVCLIPGFCGLGGCAPVEIVQENPSCRGDCDGDGAITVAELVRLVNVALGSLPLEDCAAGDRNGDGAIAIDELTRAVQHAIDECLLPDLEPTAVVPGYLVSAEFDPDADYVCVRNQGGPQIGGFAVDVSVAERPDDPSQRAWIENVAPGEERCGALPMKVDSPSAHVLADPEDTVEEWNEDNNTQDVPVWR